MNGNIYPAFLSMYSFLNVNNSLQSLIRFGYQLLKNAMKKYLAAVFVLLDTVALPTSFALSISESTRSYVALFNENLLTPQT